MMKRIFASLILTLVVLGNAGCWTTPETGKVQVQTIWGDVKKVVRPPGIWTIFTVGDEYHDVNLRSQTNGGIVVKAASKEPANFKIEGQLIYSLPDDDNSIIGFVKKFGLTEEERNGRLLPQISALFQTEFRNVASNYDAYKLVAEQENIQKQLFDTLKPKFKEQFFLTLDSIAFSGKPDFDNDNIDNAASQVVANQKLKEAAEAAYSAKQVEVETKKLDALTFSNPQLLELEKLRLQVEIAKALAAHQGTLVLGNGTGLNITSNK